MKRLSIHGALWKDVLWKHPLIQCLTSCFTVWWGEKDEHAWNTQLKPTVLKVLKLLMRAGCLHSVHEMWNENMLASQLALMPGQVNDLAKLVTCCLEKTCFWVWSFLSGLLHSRNIFSHAQGKTDERKEVSHTCIDMCCGKWSCVKTRFLWNESAFRPQSGFSSKNRRCLLMELEVKGFHVRGQCNCQARFFTINWVMKKFLKISIQIPNPKGILNCWVTQRSKDHQAVISRAFLTGWRFFSHRKGGGIASAICLWAIDSVLQPFWGNPFHSCVPLRPVCQEHLLGWENWFS